MGTCLLFYIFQVQRLTHYLERSTYFIRRSINFLVRLIYGIISSTLYRKAYFVLMQPESWRKFLKEHKNHKFNANILDLDQRWSVKWPDFRGFTVYASYSWIRTPHLISKLKINMKMASMSWQFSIYNDKKHIHFCKKSQALYIISWALDISRVLELVSLAT